MEQQKAKLTGAREEPTEQNFFMTGVNIADRQALKTPQSETGKDVTIPNEVDVLEVPEETEEARID